MMLKGLEVGAIIDRDFKELGLLLTNRGTSEFRACRKDRIGDEPGGEAVAGSRDDWPCIWHTEWGEVFHPQICVSAAMRGLLYPRERAAKQIYPPRSQSS